MTRVIFCCALVFLLASSSAALAQQSADLVALGVKEFDLGRTEFNLGHYEKSLEHFEASYRLTGKNALLYNIGFVNRQLYARTRDLEQLKRAIERYESFLSSTRSDQDARVLSLRPKADKELREMQEELRREQTQRARGEEALAIAAGLLGKGKLDEAEAQIDRFERNPANERPSVARAFALRGVLAVVRGQREQAVQQFARALSLDRGLDAPDDLEMGRAFAAAQAQLAGKPALEVAHAAPGSIKPGAPVELAFQTASDPMGLIKGVQIHYRAGGGAFSTLPVKPVGKVLLPATFYAALQPGQKVEYYGEVVDGNGAILQHLGTTALPFSVGVEAQKQGPPVTKRWWFWTVTVGVVAVAAVGVGLGIGLNRPERAQQISVDNFGLLHW